MDARTKIIVGGFEQWRKILRPNLERIWIRLLTTEYEKREQREILGDRIREEPSYIEKFWAVKKARKI